MSQEREDQKSVLEGQIEALNEDIKELIEELRHLIQGTRGAESLESVQQEAYQMQQRYFELLEQKKNPAEALEFAQKLSKLLDRNLPLFPYDPFFQYY